MLVYAKIGALIMTDASPLLPDAEREALDRDIAYALALAPCHHGPRQAALARMAPYLAAAEAALADMTAQRDAAKQAHASALGLTKHAIGWMNKLRDERNAATESAKTAFREGMEQAAQIAAWAHMVPPDGGSPTDAEQAVAEEAARRIRAALAASDGDQRAEGER